MSVKIGDLELRTVEELSEKLGIQKVTIRKLFGQGPFKDWKVANGWYVTADSLRSLFEEGEEVGK